MQDRLRTQRLQRPGRDAGFESWSRSWQATVVVVEGGGDVLEVAIDKPSCSMGRGPGVDWAFDDSAMSREHAALEFTGGGFRIRDLGSTNGTLVNGVEVQAKELAHGDKIELGKHVFQLLIEKHEQAPRTYVLPDA